MTISKLVAKVAALAHGLIARADVFLQPYEDRLSRLFFGSPMDNVAFVIALMTILRDASYMQALGWIPRSTVADPSWQPAAALFSSSVNFWALILPPSTGMVILTGSAAAILTGLVLGNQKHLLVGLLGAGGFWYYSTGVIWTHLGALPALQAAGGLAFVTSWVFRDVYKREHDRSFKAEQVTESAKLMGQLIQLVEENPMIFSTGDGAVNPPLREASAGPR